MDAHAWERARETLDTDVTGTVWFHGSGIELGAVWWRLMKRRNGGLSRKRAQRGTRECKGPATEDMGAC